MARRNLYSPSSFDKKRAWNYSSNYLNGSSSNEWYVETGQIPFDSQYIRNANIHIYKIYADETNASNHLAAIASILSVDPLAKFIVLRFITYNTDYSLATGSTNRTAAIAKFTGMITNLMGEDAIIGWGFGNENNATSNLTPSTLYDWYSLLEEAVQAGKAIDGTRFYFSANQEVASIRYGEWLVPSIDIWGVNIYRGGSLGTLYTDIQKATIKPVIITEFGISRTADDQSSQNTQASEIIDLIKEIEGIFPLVRGWVHFKFTDSVTPGTVYGSTAPNAQGTDTYRTKFSSYTNISDYCNTHTYGVI